MLSHMGDEDKFNLTGKLCQEVSFSYVIHNNMFLLIVSIIAHFSGCAAYYRFGQPFNTPEQGAFLIPALLLQLAFIAQFISCVVI